MSLTSTSTGPRWRRWCREMRHRPGEYKAASREDAPSRNEQQALLLENEAGRRVLVVQIAGLFARRIVPFAKAGNLARGSGWASFASAPGWTSTCRRGRGRGHDGRQGRAGSRSWPAGAPHDRLGGRREAWPPPQTQEDRPAPLSGRLPAPQPDHHREPVRRVLRHCGRHGWPVLRRGLGHCWFP